MLTSPRRRTQDQQSRSHMHNMGLAAQRRQEPTWLRSTRKIIGSTTSMRTLTPLSRKKSLQRWRKTTSTQKKTELHGVPQSLRKETHGSPHGEIWEDQSIGPRGIQAGPGVTNISGPTNQRIHPTGGKCNTVFSGWEYIICSIKNHAKIIPYSQQDRPTLPGPEGAAKKGSDIPDMENIQASVCGRVPKPCGRNKGNQWGRRIPPGQHNVRNWRGARAPHYGGNVRQGHRIKTNRGS